MSFYLREEILHTVKEKYALSASQQQFPGHLPLELDHSTVLQERLVRRAWRAQALQDQVYQKKRQQGEVFSN